MQGQPILLLEEVDVRRADDPEDSKVLTLTKFALPELKLKEADHTPGGGIGSVNFLLPMVDALEPKFSTKGLDLDVARKFGFAMGQFDKWTFAASMRNKFTNKLLKVRCTIQGKVASWTPGEHTPGELIDCDHVIKEVVYSDLVVEGDEIYAWSFYGRFWRQDGTDVFAEYRNALGA